MKEALLEEGGLVSVSVVTQNEVREVTEYFFLLARLPLKLSLKNGLLACCDCKGHCSLSLLGQLGFRQNVLILLMGVVLYLDVHYLVSLSQLTILLRCLQDLSLRDLNRCKNYAFCKFPVLL